MSDCAYLAQLLPSLQSQFTIRTNNCCNTQGVVCRAGRITRLYLNDTNAMGTIPSQLSLLTALEWLHLERNQLSGPIPSSIGTLTQLTSLHLNNNQLSGSIPAELGNITTLQTLYLFNNQLSGPIPPELGKLTRLSAILLHNNPNLVGPTPPEWQSLQMTSAQCQGVVPVNNSFYCCNLGSLCVSSPNQRPLNCGQAPLCPTATSILPTQTGIDLSTSLLPTQTVIELTTTEPILPTGPPTTPSPALSSNTITYSLIGITGGIVFALSIAWLLFCLTKKRPAKLLDQQASVTTIQERNSYSVSVAPNFAGFQQPYAFVQPEMQNGYYLRDPAVLRQQTIYLTPMPQQPDIQWDYVPERGYSVRDFVADDGEMVHEEK
ncbi:hypothetical protein EDD86DRAFT_211441 [Gorgonomyces haynaldii]|nr:hypothetical protein EDD86DRAFT_211441 [Gorgonomyces haynaldii]